MRVVNAAAQRRAAELVGKGATRKEAAAAVAVCERTVREWLKKPELAAIAHQTRQDTLDPTVAGALREALAALTRDGRPDHPTRLRAASILLGISETPAPAATDAQSEIHVSIHVDRQGNVIEPPVAAPHDDQSSS